MSETVWRECVRLAAELSASDTRNVRIEWRTPVALTVANRAEKSRE